METNENNEVELSLVDTFYLLLSKLPFIIMLIIVGVVAGFAYAKVIMPEKYTSSVSIYVNNASTFTQQDEIGKATATDIAASKALAGTYIVILEDDSVYDEVSKRMLEEFEPNDLSKMFTISYDEGVPSISADQIRALVNIESVNDTEVIKITTTSRNPQVSAYICKYISEIAPDMLTRITQSGAVETIGSPKIPREPSSPNVKKVAALGGIGGMLIAVIVVIVSNLLDTRIKTADDIKNKFSDVVILAEIPDLYESKGGTKYEYK